MEKSLDNSVTRHQKFKMERVHRSQLKNAEYNPRTITDEGKKRLRSSLKRRGLISPLTWNRLSGNLVSGHQRISQIDTLEGTDDYWLDVAVVEMDEKAEKEANVAMNNDSIGGSWNISKLTELYKNDKIDIEATGFDVGSAFRLMGVGALIEQPERLMEWSEKIRASQAQMDRVAKKAAQKDDPNFFLVVFADASARAELLGALGLPDAREVDGRILMERMGLYVG